MASNSRHRLSTAVAAPGLIAERADSRDLAALSASAGPPDHWLDGGCSGHGNQRTFFCACVHGAAVFQALGLVADIGKICLQPLEVALDAGSAQTALNSPKTRSMRWRRSGVGELICSSCASRVSGSAIPGTVGSRRRSAPLLRQDGGVPVPASPGPRPQSALR